MDRVESINYEKELYFKNYNYIMKKINFPGFHCSACVVLVVHCGFNNELFFLLFLSFFFQLHFMMICELIVSFVFFLYIFKN